MYSIRFKNVSKKYEKSSSRPLLIKNIFIKKKYRLFSALKNVSFDIKKGESIGIIGSNGSGKSTVLKLISKISYPTGGDIFVDGKVVSLIELGAGFHPDLSGFENLFLNATLLGLTKDEINKNYKNIIEYSGLSEYIHEPIRSYSSGMIVRLGFSIAVHSRPDILLVDEVLSVGDEVFQKKSIDTMRSLQSRGITIVFVSHIMPLVESYSDRVIWIDKGEIRSIGTPEDVINKYLFFSAKNKHNNKKNITETKVNSEKEIEILNVLLNNRSISGQMLHPKKKLSIKISYSQNKKIDQKIVLGVAVFRNGVHLFGSNINLPDIYSGKKTKKTIELNIPKHPFLHGDYSIDVGVSINNQWNTPSDYKKAALNFSVKKTLDTLIVGWITADFTWKI